MDNICNFNSTCPCYEENRCTKMEPDAECIVRLIDIYKNLHNAHSKVLSDMLLFLAQQCSIQNNVNDYFKNMKLNGV